MEFTPEFVTEQKLSEDQMTAINGVIGEAQDASGIAELKKGWDDKANKDAQGILDGATNKIVELTSVTRNEKEKAADYISRAYGVYSKESQEKLDKATKEYEDKVTNFEGDSNLKAEIITMKEKLDPLQKKEADYDKLLTSGIVDKYAKLEVEHKDNLRAVAFGSIKPSFHKDANEFEVSARWNEFIKEIEDKYNVVLVDGEAIGIDKDNEHKRVPLKDLIKGNETLTKLVDGRQQDPLKPDQVDLREVKDVPFLVPKDADNATITKLIQEHLLKDGVDRMSPGYSDKFSDLNKKVRAA